MANKLLSKRLGQLKGNKVKNNNRAKKSFASKITPSVTSGDIVVGSSELNWKPVEIPDTLDDFGGFYGLEEIDGVDVKVINGHVQFVTHDKSNIINNKDDDEKVVDYKDKIEIDETASLDDVVEFKNLDDVKVGELTDGEEETMQKQKKQKQKQRKEQVKKVEPESKNEEQEESTEDKEEDKEEDTEGNAEESNDDDLDPLKSNVFSADLALDDISPSELPDWTDAIGELSFTTLHGLTTLGFNKPTAIQEQAIPLALNGRDIMGKASTGSGKTLAYGIPILETLIKTEDTKKAIALIFTPTRELAQQVTQHLQKIAKLVVEKSPYALLSLTGGLSIQKQQRLLKYEGSGRIVVATPGRFLELLEKDGELIKRFAQIDTLVLDEADRLLQDGHFDEFEKILKHLGVASKSNGHTWQTMIFSATFAVDLFDKLSTTSWKNMKKTEKDENEMQVVLKHLMTKINFRCKPVLIDTNPEDKVSSQIKEALIECAATERDLSIYYFITMYPGATLIFCNAIDSVKKLTQFLTNLNISAYQLHSSMTQKNRLKNLEKYQLQMEKNKALGKPTVLVGSDVAARGLDIPGIQHVIHYHLPRSADVYIHRSGRTARGDKKGVSVMICSPEEAMGPLRKLRKVLTNKKGKAKGNAPKKWQKSVPLLPVDSEIISQLKERSRLASELADHDIASSSLRKDGVWMKKAAEELELDFDSDDEIIDSFLAKNKTRKMNKTLGKDESKGMRVQLNQLLSKQLRKDMRKKYLTGGLVNLADDIMKKRGHNNIIGHEKVDALETLTNKRRKSEK